MKSNEDNKTRIFNILVRNIFFMFKTSLLLLNYCLSVYTILRLYKGLQLIYVGSDFYQQGPAINV